MKVVPVSNEKGEITDHKLLGDAERVHRQLRPHLADYAGRMREVLAAGAQMAVAVDGGEVRGVTVFRILEKTHSGRDPLGSPCQIRSTSRLATPSGHVLSLDSFLGIHFLSALQASALCAGPYG